MKHVLLIGIALSVLSCSSPLSRTYNKETVEEDLKLIKEKVDTSDFQLLAGTIFRFALQEKDFNGMTYQELLDDGKKWKAEQEKIEAEQKALAEKAAKEEAERIRRLQSAVMVSCFDKGFSEIDYFEYITYKFVIQNKSDKNIRAVKGSITFTNLFDDEIKTMNFVYDQSIEVGKEVTWKAQTDYNQFLDEDQDLRNKDLKDLKVVWKPEKVIFEDGTMLE